MTVNSVLCTKCDQWIDESCFILKKVTRSAARFFVCSTCNKTTNGAEKVQQEVMFDEVKTIKKLCYLGNRLNLSGGSQSAETLRTKLAWHIFLC